jgi:hypothetical protein
LTLVYVLEWDYEWGQVWLLACGSWGWPWCFDQDWGLVWVLELGQVLVLELGLEKDLAPSGNSVLIRDGGS